MATKTVLNVRTDAAVKRAAQKAAKNLGVSLSTVVNASLREFVRNPRIELEPLVPNAKTRRMLDQALAEPLGRRFDSMDEFLEDLNSR